MHLSFHVALTNFVSTLKPCEIWNNFKNAQTERVSVWIISSYFFSTFNYETGQHRPSNCQNRTNLALGEVLKVILHFLKKLNKSKKSKLFHFKSEKYETSTNFFLKCNISIIAPFES